MTSMRLPPKSPDSLISMRDCVAESARLFDTSASWLSGRDAEQLRNSAISIRKELEALRTFFNSSENDIDSYVKGNGLSGLVSVYERILQDIFQVLYEQRRSGGSSIAFLRASEPWHGLLPVHPLATEQLAAQRRAIGRLQPADEGADTESWEYCWGGKRVDTTAEDTSIEPHQEVGHWYQVTLRGGERQAHFKCHFCDGRIVWRNRHYPSGCRYDSSRAYFGTAVSGSAEGPGLYTRWALQRHFRPRPGETFSRLYCPYQEKSTTPAAELEATRRGFEDTDALFAHIQEFHGSDGCCVIL